MTPLIAAPMWPSTVRIPRSLRPRIGKGIALRHGLIENIAAGKWPKGIDGWRLKRRLRRADVVFMDWENEPIDLSTTYTSVLGELAKEEIYIFDRLVWHIDARVPAYAASLHLDYRGRGAGTPNPDDDRPWTPELVADFVDDQIRKGCQATGLGSVWAFCSTKYAGSDVPIPFAMWSRLVSSATQNQQCAGLLIFGSSDHLNPFLSSNTEKIFNLLAGLTASR